MLSFETTFEIITFLFVVAATFAVVGLTQQASILRRRLGAGASANPDRGQSFLNQQTVNSRFLKWVQSSSSISEAKDRQKLARNLAFAGFEQTSAPAWFVVIRFSLAIGLPLLFLLVARLLGGATVGRGPVFWSLMLSAVGFLAPRSFLTRRARSRNAQVEREFPDALDLMVVCVEAGLGIAAAFVRVGQEMRHSHPRIAAEFERISEKLRAGQSQGDALRGMADRSSVPSVKSFAALVIQTETLGASVAQSLRIYAREMRQTRMLKAEEKALRIPVLMTVPLVVCILPVIVAALMLPALLDVSRVLIPALANGGF
jgi:tight adherence protein C